MRTLLLATITGAWALLGSAAIEAAELVTLTPQTWDAFAPAGKEADRIYGDFVLRNEQIVVVVAQPLATRNANMTVKNVGGAIIDLTSAARPNDQLSAFYPGGKTTDWRSVEIDIIEGAKPSVTDPARAHVKAEEVSLTCRAAGSKKTLAAEVQYTLADQWPYVLVETTYRNENEWPLDLELLDEVRADNSFTHVDDGEAMLFWVYDKWWGQAYGVVADGAKMFSAAEKRGFPIRYQVDGKAKITVQGGASFRFKRRLFPATDHVQLRQIANYLAHEPQSETILEVVDSAGRGVAAADIEVFRDGYPYATARTPADGKLSLVVPDESEFTARVKSQPHGEKTVSLKPGAVRVELPSSGYVVAKITAENGGTLPCKVEFRGVDENANPFFNHASGEHGVENLYYSHDGVFRVSLAPGRYECIISRGSEYDAVFKTIDVQRGEETPLQATLVRSVNTPGWISADFHSHASPSGDNTASQYGRVLNLLCEHIEYAPCTEHNRLSSYEGHLDRLKARHLMATCTGLELTDTPLPVNHHNAFPLILKPRTQDNGAPTSDADVELKVERLAMWDGGSQKVLQQNHPDIGNVFFDRNGDGSPDQGFNKMFKHLNCIEVHPLQTIFEPARIGAPGRQQNNRIVNWLQLLNQGFRLPGTVCTDAHYNFHGSGFLRIYVKCPTDDPANVQTADIVRATQRGQIIMTTGPYLETFLEAAAGGERSSGVAGDDIAARDGKCTLGVRVQCPNWFDIDRVQVLISGRPIESLNFTRDKTPERFAGGVVKFDQRIPLELKSDAHVIVVAAGMNSTHGPVRGPTLGKQKPFAVSNPIYVDVDGDGFKANGDTLGATLPVISGHNSTSN